jgi:hypothetical protein
MILINNIYKDRFVNKNDKLRFTKLLHTTRLYFKKVKIGLLDGGKIEYSKELDRFNLDMLKNNFFKLLYCHLYRNSFNEFYDVLLNNKYNEKN